MTGKYCKFYGSILSLMTVSFLIMKDFPKTWHLIAQIICVCQKINLQLVLIYTKFRHF